MNDMGLYLGGKAGLGMLSTDATIAGVSTSASSTKFTFGPAAGYN